MLELVLIGLNHTTASIELRERVVFSDDERALALKTLHCKQDINEIVFVSTCNRTEALVATNDFAAAVLIVKKYISQFKKIPINQFEKSLYVYQGDAAARHIFRVAASLDSMMLGEPQILGQVKDAYRAAAQNRTSGVILNRLMHKAFFVAKRVRTETGIGGRAVSISYAAIELGKKIFGTLEGKKVLLIGAGEMAELAVEHLIRNLAKDIIVANRTFESGVELANRFNGQAIRIEEIVQYLQYADIIISSTGSPDFVIKRDQVKKILRTRKNRPIFFIDIAVPRDIDPAINRLANSYVYDIDDLKDIIDENIKDRSLESIKGERIVDEAVIKFRKWHESLEAIPTIIALREKMEKIAKMEIGKTLSSLAHLSNNDSQAICKMLDVIIKKIMHDPTLFLKANGWKKDNSVHLDFTKKLFNLDS